jgi:hypothetical protein
MMPRSQVHHHNREENVMTKIISTAPVELSDAQLDQVTGGALTPITEQVNGGGNTPNGNAKGVPEVVVAVENPAGHRPPGAQP